MSLLQRSLHRGVGEVLPVRQAKLRVPLWLVLLAWCCRRSARAAWWLAVHPRFLGCLLTAGALVWLIRTHGALPALAGGSVTVATLAVWAATDRPSFARWVAHPARARWRRLTTYRRWWQPAMATAGLDVRDHLPELGRVRHTGTTDVVRARMLPGQRVIDYSAAGERLAQTFGVLDVRARPVPGGEHLVDLYCLTRDPLATPVPVPAPTTDLHHVPVGVREDGKPLRLKVLHNHWLVAGETGSGKGSVIWSLLCGMAPAIESGHVRVLAIDPKGGMELAAGEPLFHDFVYGQPSAHGGPWQEPMAVLLEYAVQGMQARAARMRGVTRLHTPTPAEPLVLVVVDELAALTAYVTDSALQRRIASALSLLLSQGRAVGVSVVAATQDARKEVLAMRDLFPARIGLRAAEAPQADMVLGRGARDRGARTDHISEALPGVAFITEDGSPDPVRVRFAHVTDDHIADVVDEYRPHPVLL